jgi:putative exporter of polyketide antibiotics
MAGMAALGLYAAALAGIGVAVGGLFGPGLAVPVVFAVALFDFLADVLAPILDLPDWVEQLALTSHLGRPMIGEWDWPGMAACLLIAAGGLVLGAWGMRRRDVEG